jgi:hypothetical protein
MKYFCLRITAILLTVTSLTNPAQADTSASAAGIRVQVYGIHYGGNIVYNYKVINNSNTPFNNFTIGGYFDNEKNFAFPQLTRLPLGWSYGREGETGPAIILAQGSTNHPAYWTSHVYGQEGTANYYLEWRTPWGQSSNAIQPRQTIEGFAVTVPLVDNMLTLPRVTGKPVFTGPDEMYIKGGFKIGYRPSGSNYQEVWGTLERFDTTPPSLTVSLSPDTLWPPNGKQVPITATLTVKDDYDPAPEIQLVSIMANEAVDISDAKDALPGTDDRSFYLTAKRAGTNTAGRIYTVTYSATDGSGNKATASATVTVPHDQGK